MFTADITRRNFVKQTSAATLLAGLPFFSGGCSANPAKDIAAKILIIGGGAAGISVAARLRRKLDKADITLVDPADKHFYQPGFTFIGAGIWKADDVWMKQEKLIPSGVKWIKNSVVEVDLTGNVAIALGAEQYGLTAKWMDGAGLRVRIPMLGLADSLNVSAAATILVYEAVRQRIAAGIDQVPEFVPWHGEGAHDH